MSTRPWPKMSEGWGSGFNVETLYRVFGPGRGIETYTSFTVTRPFSNSSLLLLATERPAKVQGTEYEHTTVYICIQIILGILSSSTRCEFRITTFAQLLYFISNVLFT